MPSKKRPRVYAIDTVVLVRYLTNDDPVQSPRAKEVIEKSVADGNRLLLTDIVLYETVWVLKRVYRLPRERIAMILRRILHTDGFAFQDTDTLTSTLQMYEEGTADFADYLLVTEATRFGCDRVYTFDPEMLTVPGCVEPT